MVSNTMNHDEFYVPQARKKTVSVSWFCSNTIFGNDGHLAKDLAYQFKIILIVILKGIKSNAISLLAIPSIIHTFQIYNKGKEKFTSNRFANSSAKSYDLQVTSAPDSSTESQQLSPKMEALQKRFNTHLFDKVLHVSSSNQSTQFSLATHIAGTTYSLSSIVHTSFYQWPHWHFSESPISQSHLHHLLPLFLLLQQLLLQHNFHRLLYKQMDERLYHSKSAFPSCCRVFFASKHLSINMSYWCWQIQIFSLPPPTSVLVCVVSKQTTIHNPFTYNEAIVDPCWVDTMKKELSV